MTHSEPPRELFSQDDPHAMNSRPTPAVPLRAWCEEDHQDDEPTSVIRADKLLAAVEALKTGDHADLSGLETEPDDAKEPASDITKVTEQKFWDGRPSHMALSAQRAPEIEVTSEEEIELDAPAAHSATPPRRKMSVARTCAGLLLLFCVTALAYQTTLYFAPRSAAIQSLLQAIYK